MVHHVSEHQNSKIQGWKIMMNICYTPHEKEGRVVQEPTEEGYLSCVQKMIPFPWVHIDVFSLLAEEIDQKHKY